MSAPACKQIGNKRPPEIIWTGFLQFGLFNAPQQNIHYALIDQTPQHNAPAGRGLAFDAGD